VGPNELCIFLSFFFLRSGTNSKTKIKMVEKRFITKIFIPYVLAFILILRNIYKQGVSSYTFIFKNTGIEDELMKII
jgi:hypothetical protein